MNRRITKLLLGLCHENMDFLLTPSHNLTKKHRCVRINGCTGLNNLALPDLFQHRVLGPVADRNLYSCQPKLIELEEPA